LALDVTERSGSSARMDTATAKRVLHEAERCTETCACGGITLYGALVTHQPGHQPTPGTHVLQEHSENLENGPLTTGAAFSL
jgi:hypothetical protein